MRISTDAKSVCTSNLNASALMKSGARSRLSNVHSNTRAVILSLQRIKDRLTGPASVRFLATLRPRDRDEIASADERRAAIQLRKQMLTTTALKERGWTRSMIIKLLGRPDTLAPSFYGTMRWLFFIDRVERVEGSAEFRAWHNKQRSVSR